MLLLKVLHISLFDLGFMQVARICHFFPGSLDDAIRESCNQPTSNVIILFYSKLPFDLTIVCGFWSKQGRVF